MVSLDRCFNDNISADIVFQVWPTYFVNHLVLAIPESFLHWSIISWISEQTYYAGAGRQGPIGASARKSTHTNIADLVPTQAQMVRWMRFAKAPLPSCAKRAWHESSPMLILFRYIDRR